jgi:hypothetical protein
MPDELTKAVVTHASGRVLGGRGNYAEARIVFRYERADPYAVVVTVAVTGQSRVVWILARDLFYDGLHRLTGTGDATVGPATGDSASKLHLTLRNGFDSAVIEIRAADVEAFLRDTDALVKRGRESLYIDIDGALTRLFAGRGRPPTQDCA